jgi:hypothetical protein
MIEVKTFCMKFWGQGKHCTGVLRYFTGCDFLVRPDPNSTPEIVMLCPKIGSKRGFSRTKKKIEAIRPHFTMIMNFEFLKFDL